MQSATPPGRIKEPTTGFAPACFPPKERTLQGGGLSQSSHVGNQRPQPQHEREDSNRTPPGRVFGVRYGD